MKMLLLSRENRARLAASAIHPGSTRADENTALLGSPELYWSCL